MNAMGVLIYVIIILVAIMLRILFASIMNGVAIKKGQVEAHAFPIVFFLELWDVYMLWHCRILSSENKMKIFLQPLLK